MRFSLIPSSSTARKDGGNLLQVGWNRHDEEQEEISSSTRSTSDSRRLIKTEMCASISLGVACAFGNKCKYAHHADELSLQTLVERDEAGLIDIETFRTRPCLDYVMTGSW